MSPFSEREAAIDRERRRLDVEAMALRFFNEAGQFTLAIPGYQRMQWRPKTESEALRDAKQAADMAVNTPPLPMSYKG